MVRDTLRSALTVNEQPHLVDTATLLASELVGNVLRHSNGRSLVRMRGHGDTVRISVWDRGPGLPRRTAALPDSTDGRGLTLLDACADRWGVVTAWRPGSGTPGKSVWFELSGARVFTDCHHI
ncbi:hypothetical protein AQ490_08790 [Wenjunlia vitaminophila]|uniref:Histidine kinase/HSP90-like ATPase domain-containing protein n=1 Tax=Wenjunlia vitaminophila TaxID=76728 RepID=A0A0T6LLP2_WENVI|nr:hypothetical protein AQ490_08790 [Wenjunlia vitaminophila]